MKISPLYVGLLVLMFISCKEDRKEFAKGGDKIKELESVGSQEGYTMLKTKCYACHNPDAKSHEVVIAPPMAAVKRRYLRSFDDQENFMEAIADWAVDPKEEKALMWGAVSQFGVMPYQKFDKMDMRRIAAYIYENELEVPDWFESHQNEMQGMGNRNRRRMGRNN